MKREVILRTVAITNKMSLQEIAVLDPDAIVKDGKIVSGDYCIYIRVELDCGNYGKQSITDYSSDGSIHPVFDKFLET